MRESSTTNENIPAMEVERKYLMASKDDAKKLEAKIVEIFPDSRLIGAWSERSYYLPRVTKARARELLDLVVRDRGNEGTQLLAKLDSIPESTPIQIRFRHRKNHWDSNFILTFKASANPLHDTERIEIETSDISERYIEGFAANGVEPESIWHSMRREYAIDEKTKIDVQNVTGYGWTADIESSDLIRVDEIADKLGLRPLSEASLDAMYRQYGKDWQKYYAGEGDDRHFSEDDWKEIGSVSGENISINKLD